MAVMMCDQQQPPDRQSVFADCTTADLRVAPAAVAARTTTEVTGLKAVLAAVDTADYSGTGWLLTAGRNYDQQRSRAISHSKFSVLSLVQSVGPDVPGISLISLINFRWSWTVDSLSENKGQSNLAKGDIAHSRMRKKSCRYLLSVAIRPQFAIEFLRCSNQHRVCLLGKILLREEWSTDVSQILRRSGRDMVLSYTKEIVSISSVV